MISTAPPRAIAGKIASTHNRRECKHCRRPFPTGGVLAFGLSGSDARWYPDEDTARRNTTGVRYVFPVHDQDIDPAQVIDWLEHQRDEIDALIEEVEQERMERRARREIREQFSGFRTEPWPCDDCGHPKYRPAERCDHCGDEPVPIGIDPNDYNRARGYAF